MKYFQAIIVAALLCASPSLFSQTVLVGGPAIVPVTLVPFVPNSCFSNGSTNAVACGSPVTFNFTSFQISSCPNSGKIPAPGSVAYGGPGSSASFTFYHTLSYSPSNEHQQLVFNAPINVFQFSTSGPASGIGEVFRVQTYNGAALVSTHTFNTPGPGANLTYTISGTVFTRVQFTEINAISADDELFGDFMVAGPGCPLPLNGLTISAEVLALRQVRIDWETQDEVQMDHFAVERSSDGQLWVGLHEAPATNLPGTHAYTWDDQGAPQGIQFYRIAARGLDGETHFSNVVQVDVRDPDAFDMVVYPNPARQQTTLDFRGMPGEKSVTLLNALGQVLRQQQVSDGSLLLDLQGLSPAVYSVQVRCKDQVLTRNIVVQ